jgi:hypothetical protein
MLKSIRIENPVSGCRFTSKNRAKRFVAQGRSVWVEPDVSIRFIASDHRHRAAQESADMTRYWYERAAHTGMATLAEVANLSAARRAKTASVFWESAIWSIAYGLKPPRTEPDRRHSSSGRNARREDPSGTRVFAMLSIRQQRQRGVISLAWGRTPSGVPTSRGGRRSAAVRSRRQRLRAIEISN